MEINLLERSKNTLRIELIGEGHSFCNALHEMLLKDDSIDFAGYTILHPLVAQPIFLVRMKGRKKPENSLIKGSKNLYKNLDRLQRTFNRSVKKYK